MTFKKIIIATVVIWALLTAGYHLTGGTNKNIELSQNSSIGPVSDFFRFQSEMMKDVGQSLGKFARSLLPLAKDQEREKQSENVLKAEGLSSPDQAKDPDSPWSSKNR